ncbi:Pyridoxal phosphate-dependent transferase, major domain [Sesbania bispinosa]|nr:Pyridoxal phosphate-dependent transferase, major domain [Sesbania bispinosa]
MAQHKWVGCPVKNFVGPFHSSVLFQCFTAALGVPVDRLVQAADSVSVCLSKGIGAPVGSIIVGSKSFIAKAKKLRKTLGGGMRQIGMLCAAALVGLQENVGKLESDHKKARVLADGLNEIKGVRVDARCVETNIIENCPPPPNIGK